MAAFSFVSIIGKSINRIKITSVSRFINFSNSRKVIFVKFHYNRFISTIISINQRNIIVSEFIDRLYIRLCGNTPVLNRFYHQLKLLGKIITLLFIPAAIFQLHDFTTFHVMTVRIGYRN